MRAKNAKDNDEDDRHGGGGALVRAVKMKLGGRSGFLGLRRLCDGGRLRRQ